MIEWKFCPACATEMILDSEGRPACPQGHFTKYPTPVAATAAFVEYDGKYLVIKRNFEPCKGAWDLPGGFAEYDETGLEAIEREIQEETGLTNLDFLEILTIQPSDYGDLEKVFTAIYMLKSPSDNIQLSDENSEYAWLPLEEIDDLAFEDTMRALKILKERMV